MTEYSSLVWHLMPHHGGPQPVTTTCLFTDGYGDGCMGWWSRSEQKLYAPNVDGTRDIADHLRFKWWAEWPNLQGFKTPAAMPGVEC